MTFAPLRIAAALAGLAWSAAAASGSPTSPADLLRAAVVASGSPLWSPDGPEGGPIQSIVVAPSGPSLAYSATPYGGLFRSSDGGASWERPSAGIPQSYGVVDIAVDAADPSILYALTRDSSPVLKSADGGENWAALEPAPNYAFGLTPDPNRGGVLFAYGLGVSVTEDAGGSWHERNDGFGCPTPGSLPEISALEVAPSDSSIVYAGTSAASVCRDEGASATFYASMDGGAHWSATAFPADTGPVNAIAVGPADPNVILVATASGLFRSADAGSSWTAAPGFAAANVTAVAWSAVDPARAFASASVFEPSGETVETFYRSVDGGATWQGIGTSSNEFVSVIASTRAGAVLAGFRRNGIFRSGDDGETWAFANAGIRAVPVDSVAVASTKLSRIWLGTADGRVFRSDDGGGSWTRTALDTTGNVSVFPDPKRSSTIYAAVARLLGGQVFKSVDAGAQWTEVDSGLGGLPVQIAVDPSNPEIVYASGGLLHTGNGVFKSVDGAATWRRLETPASGSPFESFGRIAIDPRDPLRLFVSSSSAGIERSEDGGDTWTVVDPPIAGLLLVLDDPASTALVAAGDGLWRSVDHGDHWTLSGRGVIAWSLAEGAGRPRPVYASGPSAQAYESTDAGATWAPLGLDGIPADAAVEIVSNGRRLFAASYAGLYAAPVPPLLVPVAPPEPPPAVKRR